MEKLSRTAVNFEYVTHVMESKYDSNQTLIYFTTGKYVIVPAPIEQIVENMQAYANAKLKGK